MPEDYRLFSAIRFRQNIVSALEGDDVRDHRISEYSLMKKFGWTYNELLSTPFHVILYLGFIENSMQTHEKLQNLKKGEKKE